MNSKLNLFSRASKFHMVYLLAQKAVKLLHRHESQLKPIRHLFDNQQILLHLDLVLESDFALCKNINEFIFLSRIIFVNMKNEFNIIYYKLN